jgi:NADPH-dependent curcumin reductase CurA
MRTEQLDLQAQFVREVGGWIGQGRLHYRETVVDGIENTLDAFLGLMRGNSIGKMVVRL